MCATIFAAGRIAIQRRVTSVCGAQTRETAASSRRDRAEAIDDPSTRSVSTHPGQAALQELTSVDYHYFFLRGNSRLHLTSFTNPESNACGYTNE